MANDRLTGLALLNVHYEKEIDIDRLIDVFASKFKHSLILGDIIDEKPSYFPLIPNNFYVFLCLCVYVL